MSWIGGPHEIIFVCTNTQYTLISKYKKFNCGPLS